MAQTGALTRPAAGTTAQSTLTLLRAGIVVVLLAAWELLARSGLLFQDVVPPLFNILSAMGRLLTELSFYQNLWVTAVEVFFALAIGGLAGITVGIVVGGSPFLTRAYESYLYYLGPTPKIIFFPIMIMWFGVGSGSKIAMGALSCFFPVALSATAGMRQIDKVLIRVGRSFRASTIQMVAKIYLPAMLVPMVNGLRLGFGVAIIGVLLAETKLSNQGLGYLIIQSYTQFNMPQMYAMLIIVFILAAVVNAAFGRLGDRSMSKQKRTT
jgi:ABC-type nitrate/sulfonate/bicarbonate transport system permease component